MTADDSTRESGQEGGGQSDDGRAPPDLGARRKPLGSVTGDSSAETSARGTAAVRVSRYWLDDEPGGVEITATVDGADVTLGLDPAEARAFAEQVAEAARFAEEGE